MADFNTLEEIVSLGDFWAGMTGKNIPIVFARTTGGYLNCVEAISGKTALATGVIRHWDTRRNQDVGAIVSTCVLTEVDPVHGRYLFEWLVSDLACVPQDPGVYSLQVDLLFPSGEETLSQRATFRVLPSAPRVYG